jgi:uncharacterized protein YkwD
MGRTGRVAALGLAAAMAFSSVSVTSRGGIDHTSATIATRMADATSHAANDVLTLFASPVHAAAQLVAGNRTVKLQPPATIPQLDVNHLASSMNRARLVAEDWARQADAQTAVLRKAAADAAAAAQQAVAAAAQQAAAAAAAQRQAAEQAAAQQAAVERAAAEQAAAQQAAAEQAAAEQAAAERAAAREARAARQRNADSGGSQQSPESTAGAGRVAAAAAAVAAPVAVAAAPASLAAAAGQTTATEDQFVDLLNLERAKVGLPGLQFDGSLLQAARGQASAIASAGALSHQSLSPLLGTWRIAGENVGYGPSVGVVNDALVRSASHYANMVNPAFTHVATAVVMTPDGRCWISEVFGGR